VAAGNGITRIDVDSPLSHFGERAGLHGAVLALQRHAGMLYVGTTEGLFHLVGGGGARFEPIPQVPGQSWGFMEAGARLLVANNEGVFALEGDTPRRVLATDQTAYSLLRSRQQPARVFVGMQNGLASIRLGADGRWVDEGRIEPVRDEVRTLVEDDGHLWLGTWSGVIRLALPTAWRGPRAGGHPVALERFGVAQGLPEGQTQVARIEGKVRFITAEGIYCFDPSTGRFSADPAFAGLFPGGPRQITALQQERRGEMWMYTADSRSGTKETGRAVRVGMRWRWEVTPLQPIAGIGMSSFHEDPDGTVWLGGDKGLFRYAPDSAPAKNGQFPVLLRKVTGHDGRLLFANHPPAGKPQIPYADNALRFEFAAPSYDHFAANRFQVLLQGVDRGWSPWTGDAYRDYTNIPEGEYRFRVRARNAYGQEGQEATFDFRILPPWYRTGWAWALWIFSGVAALGLLLRWRSAALQQRNRELAALVEQRTTELARANEALVGANEALAQQTITDPLTGLKNRRYLNDHIEQDLAAARRYGQNLRAKQPRRLPHAQLLFLMVDIDHFKEINDTHGHAAGDRVLVQLCDILRGAVRDSDTPIRWGGEEFLIVARFAPPEGGPQFAERIRAAVAAHPFDLGDGRTMHRTCSIGFASYPFFVGEPDRLNWEQVVNLADECLYAAKRGGRNAWVGIAPMHEPLESKVMDALRATLERAPEPGPLQLLTSWTQLAPEEALHGSLS
jgi:diguanylate cyclase (GGDEF)-like protein